MAATYSQYSGWSPALQKRYRSRYGSAPKGNTTAVAGGGTGQPFATPEQVANAAPDNGLYGPGVVAPPPAPPKFDPYGDVGYAASASALQNMGAHAGSEHDYQTHQGAQNYGYDSEGRLINTDANPDYNPYSQAAILKRNYDNSVRGTTNSYASQGQLYSGALKNAQDTNQYQYGLGSDQLQRAAQGFYHGNNQTLQGVNDQGLLQLAQLLGPAFANFLASQKG